MSRTREAFLSLPFDEQSGEIRTLIERVLRDRGLSVVREEVREGESPSVSVADAVRRAEVFIADVTRPSSWVMYEIGIAQAMNKPLLLLAQKSAVDLPPDVQSQVAYYDPARVGSIEKYVDYWLRDTLTA